MSVNEEMAASTSRTMSSTQCATTPSLHALRNTPMKLLFVRVALVDGVQRHFVISHRQLPSGVSAKAQGVPNKSNAERRPTHGCAEWTTGLRLGRPRRD